MTRPEDHIEMAKGQVLTREDIEQRIRNAVEDIMSDADDTAILHNHCCQGKIEHSDGDEYLCIEGEDE